MKLVKMISNYFEVVKRIFKNYWLFIILSTLLLASLVFIVFKENFCFHFTENTGYYFYSSLLQANAAIISIFGVFFIYKIQSLQSSIFEIYNSVSSRNPPMSLIDAQKFKAMDIEQKKERLKAYNRDDPVDKFYKQWYEMEINLVKIKGKIIKPLILLTTAIILQSIFLLLSNDIHFQGSTYEFISFLLTVLYESYVLILLSKSIYDITV